MLLHVVARGRIGRSPEAEIMARYLKRVSLPVKVTELPDVGGKVPKLDPGTQVIGLDETGAQWSSMEFAHKLEGWRDSGVRELRFLIGAADGLNDEERVQATAFFSFGRATWPHLMVRAMLAEQLWRATSILANHPYHREG
ncbi:23S rRNA (pseudouridine(1915)-N(3))-methyltransferase RlmH [Aquisediminimonas sediminicola]|uniref:23S rRNA (pseudouridine(1915)-N(3))-methyltransferase RlmH n=1 Tax=Alteraquisediminimonas sediminicola TaxID=2676787 RepID=UPI001C8E0655|nr:23S rRNA (pseudouridine(1915)-N(3))-methyltransferase RlmH [Aquisediminimonas sediminicola]